MPVRLSTSGSTFSHTPPPSARHRHSALSIWLSVDPLADKYPGVSPYTYCANNPVGLVDEDGREVSDDPYLIFNGTQGNLQIWDDNNTPDDYSDDTFIGQYMAHNNVASSSLGKWEDGIYEMADKNARRTHSKEDDSPNGPYGEGGCYCAVNFIETTTGKIRKGMAIHAGREHKPFLKRVTLGCVRTTAEAMIAIDEAISKYGPLQKIIIQNNRQSDNSETANSIHPFTRPTLPTLSPLVIPFREIKDPVLYPADKTRVASPVILFTTD